MCSDIVNFNEELLRVCAQTWHSLEPIQPADVELLCDQGFVLRAIGLLRKKLALHAPFGFKDPRTTKLLPFWRRVFAAGGFDVRYVFALRNPVSVTKSLAKRNHFEIEQSYLLWAEYVLTALDHLDGHAAIAVDYDQLIRDPSESMQQLARWFCVDLDANELQEYCNDFLDGALQHSTFSFDEVHLDAAAPALVIEICTYLSEVLANRSDFDSAKTTGKLDQWNGELQRLRPLLRLLDREYQQIADLDKAVDYALAHGNQTSPEGGKERS